MKLARSIIRVSAVAVVLCSASAAVVTMLEPTSPAVAHVATSRTAPTDQTSGFKRALESASDPHMHGNADVQPLVGPLRSVKAPNLRQNLSKFTGQEAKRLAGNVATLFAKGVVTGAGGFIGAKAMGRLK
jgi:hypothetical protein